MLVAERVIHVTKFPPISRLLQTTESHFVQEKNGIDAERPYVPRALTSCTAKRSLVWPFNRRSMLILFFLLLPQLVTQMLMAYLSRLSAIAGNKINCGPALTWMEVLCSLWTAFHFLSLPLYKSC